MTCLWAFTAPGAGWGFEEGATGTPPAGFRVWAPDLGAGAGTYGLDSRRKKTGRQALRVQIPEGGYWVAFRFVPVEPGANYLLRSAVYLEEGSTAAASLTIYWSAGPAENTRLKTRHPNSTPVRDTGTWEEMKLLENAPPEATHAQIVMRLSGRGRAEAGVAWFDDLSFTEIDRQLTLGPDGNLVRRITVPNGGFDRGDENGLVNWTLVAEGGAYAGKRVRDGSSAVAHLAFVKREKNRCRAWLVSDPFAVGKPATHYEVRVRVRGRRALGAVRVHLYDARTDEKLNFWSRRMTPGANWAEVAGVMRVLPRFRDRELAFRVELRLYGEGEAWFDDVRIRPVKAPDIYWKPDAVYSWDPASPLLIGRAPEDGSTVRVNPPAFRFPPEIGAAAYRVTLSADPQLDPDRSVSRTGKDNFYLHGSVLDAHKTWYWRSAALDAEGQPLRTSPVSSFRIHPDAVPWPFPPIRELGERIGPHPRLYVRAADLPDIRARVTANPRWPAFLRRAETWLDATPKEEPVDYWDFDPWGEVYRAVYSPSQYMERVYLECAFTYLITQDRRFLDKAREFMLEQAAWDPEGPTCFQWLDQVGRSIMLNMSIAYDWLYNDLTPVERRTVQASLMARVRTTYGTQRSNDCRTLTYYPRNSHGITILGMMCTTSLALLGDVPEMTPIFEYVVPYYCAMFPPWGGADGGWSEGPNYALWSVAGHLERWETIRSALDIDLFVKPWYANHGWWRLYCIPPFVKTSWFGDGHPSRAADAGLMGALANLYRDPYFRWHAETAPGNASSGWQALLRDRAIPTKAPVDIPQSRAFRDVGWAFLHSDLASPEEVLLGFKSSPHGSQSHSHSDQNSFVLYAYGKSMAIDSGYYDSYGSPHHYRFTRRTKAHNAILIGGKGQPINDITATGTLTGFVHGAGFDYVAGQAAPAYQGRLRNWERRILFIRPDVFVIIDDLEAPRPETFQWLLHTAEKPNIDPEKQQVRTRSSGPYLQTALLWPRGLEFSSSEGFDPPPLRGKVRPTKQYHVTASTRAPASRARFVAVLAPRREGMPPPELSIEPQAPGLLVKGRIGTERVRILLPDPRADRMTAGDLSTDGRLLALTERDGKPTRLLLVDGTGAWKGEQQLVRSAKPCTVSLSYEPARTVIARDPEDSQPVSIRLDRSPRSLYLGRNGEAPLQAVPFEDGLLNLPARPWIEAYADRKPPRTQTVPVHTPAGPLAIQGTLTWQDRYALDLQAPVAAGRYRVAIRAGGHGRLRLPWDKSPRRLASGSILAEEKAIWMTDEPLQLSWDAGITLEGIAFTSLAVKGSVPAVVVGEKRTAANGAVFREAETGFTQERGQAKPYTHRAFLSNGAGLGPWTTVGHRIGWQVDVPKAGAYNLVLKGAVWDEAGALRLISLDGTELNGGVPTRFAYTDGFGAEPSQWRHFLIAAPNGRPLALQLTAGSHTLDLTAVANGMNLDYLVLLPAE